MNFVYQITKEEQDKSVKLCIYSLNDKKELKTEEIELPYVIYTLREGFEALKINSDKILLADKKLKNINNEDCVKLEFKSREIYEYVLSSLKEAKIPTFEEDLPYEHRYLIDNDIGLLSGSKTYLEPKYLSLDIETVGELKSQEIVMISTQNFDSKRANKVYCDKSKISKKNLEKIEKKKFKEFELLMFENEKDLLEKFRQDVVDFEAQILIGWNVINFDFKVIKERLDFHKIPFQFSKFSGENKLRIFNDFFKTSTLQVPGVLVMDIIDVLKMNFISFEDYKLNTVAKEVLGDEKIDLEDEGVNENGMENKINSITNMLENDTVKLIEYNFKDSLLVSQIVEKLKLMELICKRSILTGTPLNKIKSPIATLDIMYLKELHKKNLVAPSNFNFSDTNPIEGAFVLDPKKGFYEDVFVLDFKSLYPTVMMTFNVDPYTYSESGQIEAPNGVKFDKEPGILPELIQTLFKEREKAKKEKDDVKSFALKINMNSFYGAIASPKCRFHNHDIGEAITGFARHIIKKTNSFVESLGHKVVYNDTDSTFIITDKKFKSLDEKKKFGKEIEKKINDHFEEWVTKEYGQKNWLSIEFEKLFSKFFIATKKRYVGYDELSKKTSYTGMEAIRGDWTDVAKKFQMDLVDLIFSGASNEKISEFIISETKELKAGKYDENLVYTKKITKPLAQYTKTTPPHVRAAREVKNFSGRIVKYVMTENGPKHVSLVSEKDKFDYDHYVDKQLKGVADDLLESIGVDFDEVLHKKKQTALDKFF